MDASALCHSSVNHSHHKPEPHTASPSRVPTSASRPRGPQGAGSAPLSPLGAPEGACGHQALTASPPALSSDHGAPHQGQPAAHAGAHGGQQDVFPLPRGAQVTVLRQSRSSDLVEGVGVARLFLVDLAGSERASQVPPSDLHPPLYPWSLSPVSCPVVCEWDPVHARPTAPSAHRTVPPKRWLSEGTFSRHRVAALLGLRPDHPQSTEPGGRGRQILSR